MLRAACLIRPLLATRPAVSSNCAPPLLRISADYAHQQLSFPWKSPAGVRYFNMSEEPSQRTLSPGVEAALRERDKVPSEYSIIYRAPLQTYINFTYCMAWFSTVTIPIVVAAIYFGTADQSFPFEVGGVPILEDSTDSLIITAMLLITVANIGRIVSKYPYRIYRNPKEHKYIAVFQHPIPGMISKKEFVAGEVTKSSGILWKDSCYAIRKKKMLIIPEHFSTPIELERMQIDPKLNDPVEIRKRRSKML